MRKRQEVQEVIDKRLRRSKTYSRMAATSIVAMSTKLSVSTAWPDDNGPAIHDSRRHRPTDLRLISELVCDVLGRFDSCLLGLSALILGATVSTKRRVRDGMREGSRSAGHHRNGADDRHGVPGGAVRFGPRS